MVWKVWDWPRPPGVQAEMRRRPGRGEESAGRLRRSHRGRETRRAWRPGSQGGSDSEEGVGSPKTHLTVNTGERQAGSEDATKRHQPESNAGRAVEQMTRFHPQINGCRAESKKLEEKRDV